jgi:hypothetical protein
MKSPKRGNVISELEILNVSEKGLWLLLNDHEYFLPFEEFPWFKDATIAQIHKVTCVRNKYLRWDDLDVDLGIESLANLARFPLIYKRA